LIDPVPERKPRRKNGEGRALAKAEAAPAPATVTQGDAFLAMIERAARDPSVDIDKMERLLDRRDRMEAEARVRAFNEAMAAAKAEFDPIVKRHLVNRGSGGTYKHEDLADISAAVDPALARHGLNTRYRTTSNPNEPITCTCIVTHGAGHFEETALSAGADATGGKNSIQAIASTLSYLQRMTKKAALGLAASRDDDGRAAGQAAPTERITEQQAKDLEALAAKAGIEPQIIREHFKVEAFTDLTPEQFAVAKGRVEKKLKLEGAA
jgi:hypothetical protein